MALLTLGDPDRVTGGYLFHRRMAERAASHGADVHFVSIPDLPLAWAIVSGPRWRWDSRLRHADVVVLDSIAAAAAAPWLRRGRIPLVGMLHQPVGGMDFHPVVRRARVPFDRWAYRSADVLMVASEWLATQLISQGISRRRLRVMPPGKDVAPGVPDGDRADDSMRSALRRGRQIAAVCVANWLPRKGILELLEALARLPDELVSLHLVGDTAPRGGYARRVRERLEAPELRDRVTVHGVVPVSALHGMYRGADAFILPSWEEPYGTVWGEAMAAGLPVIGWRAGNLPFLAEDGNEALLAPPGDVPALSRALERVARDPELRLRMGSAAASRADSRPTWDQTAAAFFSVIEQARIRRRASGSRHR